MKKAQHDGAVSRRTFLAGTAAAVTTAGLAADPAFAEAATVRFIVDGAAQQVLPTTVYNTTLSATDVSGQARVTMSGQYSEFSIAFPAPYQSHLTRVSLWLNGLALKKGNLWLKIFDQDNEEWGTLANRVDPAGFNGLTRVTFEPQRLSRMTWSAKLDGKVTYPLRRLVIVYFPDDKQSTENFVFDLDSIELVGDGGTVASWSRAGALELTSGADRALIDSRGRILDWTSGDRRMLQTPAILPLTVHYDNGTAVFFDEATVAVDRVSADEAIVTFVLPGFFSADVAMRIREGHFELQPTRVQNLWSRPIAKVSYPEVAYRTIPATGNIRGIAPKWGGLAHTKTVLSGGFYANYGMPTATHDIILFEEDNAALGVYSVQTAGAKPYKPTQFGIVGTRAREEKLTGFVHRVDSWIKPGEISVMPPTRLVYGGSAFDLFAKYRADSGMNSWRNLQQKITPQLYSKLSNSVHLKMDMWQPTGGTSGTGNPALAFDYLKAVPGGPYSVELASYYADGQHDHNYPDFLTFDYLGGSAQFKKLIDLIHLRGNLASAYTNPTWWHPNSKAVIALGGAERIGIRDGRGNLVTKTHTGNVGYLIGGWRPECRQLIIDQLRDFRDTFGMDMMFQDEIARREYDHSADFNAPPYEYCEELVEQTTESAAVLPIGTEGVGGDRIFQDLTSSLGFFLNTMQTDRVSVYDNPNRNGVVIQQWPLGTAIMHDKIAFYPHNLDRGIDTTENLSWSLAFGLNMHYTGQQMSGDFLAGRGFEALRALSLIQRTVASRYFGKSMTVFRYVTEDLKVSRTVFAGGMEIIASHDIESRVLSMPGELGTVTVAPHGFLAVADGVPVCALINDAHHAPGYVAEWAGRFVPRIAWYPADLAGYRSNVIKSDLKLTAAPAELPAGGTTKAALSIAAWDGSPIDLVGAAITYEISDRRLAHITRDASGKSFLTPCPAGNPGWVTVRAIVTRDNVPEYSSVELVKLIS